MKLAVSLAAALVFAPSLLLADPLDQRGLEEGVKKVADLTDATIDRKRGELDRVLSRRTSEASREHAEAVSLENTLKQERLDFERKQISARRAFLESLKKEADPKKRASQYGKFDVQQKNERRKFFNKQMDAREDWASAARKTMMVAHDDVAASAPAAKAAPAKPARKPAKKK